MSQPFPARRTAFALALPIVLAAVLPAARAHTPVNSA